ncbi:MAG: hypothetical protein JSS61_04370 [Verrucomicrobia bacterium]|nr:hypothetical protein [Verrucomicrobiota bacterium]
MQHNLPKSFIGAASLLASLSCALHADVDSAQMRNLENRVSALEQRKSANGIVNPSARPEVRNGANLFLEGDLLVWQARENGLPMGIVATGAPGSLMLHNAHVSNMRSEWNAGFRVGFGYNIPHDGWDLSVSWLRFSSNTRRSAHASSSQVIYPSMLPPSEPIINNSSGACTRAQGHWRVLLNQIDLDLGREFFVSKWLTLRPHMGVRTAWIHQHWNLHYKNFLNTLTGYNNSKDNMKNNWWGIGAEGGVDTTWGLGGGWSFFGNLAASILYGYHKVRENTTDTPVDVEYAELHNSFRISHTVLDMEGGIAWDHMFCKDRFHLGFKLGIEEHVYFGQNQFPTFVDDVSRGTFVANQGDLTYQGFVFSTRFDF